MLPNFICPGAARSATTALYYLLIQHPKVFLPSLKETRFFSRDYEKGLPWYEKQHYANVKDETAIGDISPAYLMDKRCPERILKALGPEIKLIFMLRDPVDRAFSHYSMLRNHQFEDLPFEQAIERDEPDRIAKSLEYYEHEYAYQYLKESTYSQSIQRHLDVFDKDRIKYVVFEEFVADTEYHLLDILSFLGINDKYEFNLDVYKNPKTVSGSSKMNKLFYSNAVFKKVRDSIQLRTGWKFQSFLKKLKTTVLGGRGSETMSLMDEELRKRLYRDFEDETARVEALTGKDLSVWRKS